jgi:hypothetical protein
MLFIGKNPHVRGLTLSKSDLERLIKLGRAYLGETTNKHVLARCQALSKFFDGLDKRILDYDKRLAKARYDASPEGHSARYEQSKKANCEKRLLLLEKKIERAERIIANKDRLRKSLEADFEGEGIGDLEHSWD